MRVRLRTISCRIPAGSTGGMTLLRTSTLMGATLTMGLIAGAFALYAHTIMPGLRKTDDRTFVAAFQQIDRAIINPWFMITAFGGALVLTLAAGVANRGTPAFPWIAAAFGLYLVAVIVTIAVNVPMNDAIKAAGDPASLRHLVYGLMMTGFAIDQPARPVIALGLR